MRVRLGANPRSGGPKALKTIAIWRLHRSFAPKSVQQKAKGELGRPETAELYYKPLVGNGYQKIFEQLERLVLNPAHYRDEPEWASMVEVFHIEPSLLRPCLSAINCSFQYGCAWEVRTYA
jgi:hypothetical protein